MAANHAKRLLLVALMALASVNLFTGAPLFAVWVGAQFQGDSGGLSMTAVLAVIVVMALVCAALVWALNRMGAAHDTLVGRPVARRRSPRLPRPLARYLRSMSGFTWPISRSSVSVS